MRATSCSSRSPRPAASSRQSERQLVAYAQAQGIINTGTGEAGPTTSDASSLQGESLVALNSALAEATARRVMAEGAYRQAQLAGGSPRSARARRRCAQARAALEAEYQDKRTLMKPDHPDMLSLRSRIEELDRQISQRAVAGRQRQGDHPAGRLSRRRRAPKARSGRGSPN